MKDIDFQLISALEKDGRTSFTHLSRSLGCSISTIAKKYKQLVQEGVIETKAITNPHRLGLVAHAIIAIRTSVGKLESVGNKLAEYPNIELVVALIGQFNLIVSIQYPSWDQLHDFISNELSAISDIREMDIFFTKTNIKRFYDMPFARLDLPPVRIDKTDRQIIEALSDNGRLSVSNLAHMLALSVSSVSKRLSRLLDENVIKVRSIIEYRKIGYDSSAFIFIRTHRQQLDAVCDTLLKYPELSTVITLVNVYDLFLSATCKDSANLYDLVNNKIASVGGVDDIIVWPRGKIFKRTFGLFPGT
jgi:Lrp/AsnC family transcriptional regulator for asnA, asnC and gidA